MSTPAMHRSGGAPRIRRQRTVSLKDCTERSVSKLAESREPLSPVSKLAVLCCYFNPMKCPVVRQNALTFLDRINADTFVIECSFDGEFELPDSFQFVADPDTQTLWQKERLLNVAAHYVSDTYDALAWIDMDVLFENPDWQQQAREVLSDNHVCQLWSESQERHDGIDTPIRPSVMAGFVAGDPQCFHLGNYHPGFAWAMRRDTWNAIARDSNHGQSWPRRGALLESNVVGNGDTHMCRGFFDADLWTDRFMSPQWRVDADNWKRTAHRHIQKRLGCVPGTITHLWHGNRQDRKYVERLSYLGDHDFDPATDLTEGPNILLRWTESARREKPEMIAKVKGYFDERRRVETV